MLRKKKKKEEEFTKAMAEWERSAPRSAQGQRGWSTQMEAKHHVLPGAVKLVEHQLAVWVKIVGSHQKQEPSCFVHKPEPPQAVSN